MKADEWKKVKKMLPYCKGCAFMEVKLDAKESTPSIDSVIVQEERT